MIEKKAIKNDDIKKSHFHMPNPLESVKHAKEAEDRQALEFQKLCFKIFHTTEDGKDLAERIKTQLLMTAMTDPGHPQASQLCFFEAGFKEGMRGLLAHADAHKRRINEGNNGS